MSALVTTKMRPPGDRDSAPYWEGIRKHQLLVQACADCGWIRWPASPVCRKCFSMKAEWKALSGRGRIASWIVVQRPPNPAFDEVVPYAAVLVSLAEAPDLLVIGHVPRQYVAAIRRGLPLRTAFIDVDGGAELEWHPDIAN